MTTNQAIQNKLLNSKARDEIIHSLATCIMLYTIKPTPTECSLSCKRLVSKHPGLRDTVGTGYVSFYVVLSLLFVFFSCH